MAMKLSVHGSLLILSAYLIRLVYEAGGADDPLALLFQSIRCSDNSAWTMSVRTQWSFVSGKRCSARSPRIACMPDRTVRTEENSFTDCKFLRVFFSAPSEQSSNHSPRGDRTAGEMLRFKSTMDWWRIMHHFKTIATEHAKGT
ncbi:hypothetical protein EDD17DRAFT_762460 [Pisolithus thermaeus]|nr:hypothetical protein EDD17DRAFT_762460 [Pisolithus thermaeus]